MAPVDTEAPTLPLKDGPIRMRLAAALRTAMHAGESGSTEAMAEAERRAGDVLALIAESQKEAADVQPT